MDKDSCCFLSMWVRECRDGTVLGLMCIKKHCILWQPKQNNFLIQKSNFVIKKKSIIMINNQKWNWKKHPTWRSRDKVLHMDPYMVRIMQPPNEPPVLYTHYSPLSTVSSANISSHFTCTCSGDMITCTCASNFFSWILLISNCYIILNIMDDNFP